MTIENERRELIMWFDALVSQGVIQGYTIEGYNDEEWFDGEGWHPGSWDVFIKPKKTIDYIKINFKATPEGVTFMEAMKDIDQ